MKLRVPRTGKPRLSQGYLHIDVEKNTTLHLSDSIEKATIQGSIGE